MKDFNFKKMLFNSLYYCVILFIFPYFECKKVRFRSNRSSFHNVMTFSPNSKSTVSPEGVYNKAIEKTKPKFFETISTRHSFVADSTSNPSFYKSINSYCSSGNGQFFYDEDCHSFVNCWNGRGTVQPCFPSYLIFDPKKSRCEHPTSKLKSYCQKSPKKGTCDCSDTNQECCQLQSLTMCPGEYQGNLPYKKDCTKFIECWKGISVIKDCPLGTMFCSAGLVCDFPNKIRNCTLDDDDEFLDKIDVRFNKVSRSGRTVPTPESPTSGQRVRLRGGKAPYKGYVEMFRNGKWGFVCDASGWTMEEANVVCKDLGYTRGVRKTTQGLVYGSVNPQRKITESIECDGSEDSLDKCRISYAGPINDKLDGFCDPASRVVSVTCIHDSFAVCSEGEIPWGGSCYSLHFNSSSYSNAKQTCKSAGKHLVEITSQEENDLLSELLLHTKVFDSLWTGGFAIKTRRSASYVWETSSTYALFQNWWPGWNGRKSSKTKSLLDANTKGIKLSRSFDYLGPGDVQNADYYFWALENLHKKLPFICERTQKNIGCILEDGRDYDGNANRGESGEQCAEWNTVLSKGVLKDEEIVNLGPLDGNNFCRNPDNDGSPWCIVPNGEFDYCDIPSCDRQSDNEINDISIMETCPPGTFQCTLASECVLKEYVCDGTMDCSNGADEVCPESFDFSSDFRGLPGKKLEVPYVERWLDVSREACSRYCLKAEGFSCKSFNYQSEKRLCTLNEQDIGSSGKLKDRPDWNYYQIIDGSTKCDKGSECPSGKCLTLIEICDGKNDCEDGFDEKDCLNKPNLSIRLLGGKSRFEGRVEIKAFNYSFGGVCDDGFGIKEANVVCKTLGYSGGAVQAILNSHFGSGSGEIILDELTCKGTETTILDCTFSPWKVHDCSDREWAGVICRTDEHKCKDEEWKCASGECIPMDLLCDREPDCSDGSDEALNQCQSPITYRLVNGNNSASGRLEVKYKGVWGTVCDDNFGEEEGRVVCANLGFKEHKAVVHGQASFGQGKGPIWIENVSCEGAEFSLRECKYPKWSPSFRCKHIEDVGIECIKYEVSNVDSRSIYFPTDKVKCGESYVSDDLTEAELTSARISGGTQSTPGSQPWVGSIRLKGNSKTFHWCGAVILSEFHVITVAHCMEDYPKEVYRVRVGDWDMQIMDVQEQEFKVDSVFFHEEYNVDKYLNNDIALIKIQAENNGRGIKFGQRVVPICLPHANVDYSDKLECHISGWGSTGISHPGFTRYMKVAKIPYLETSACMKPHVYGSSKLSGGMFCAGFLDGGVDSCQGDSGGGLVCQVENRTALLGLTSWGYGCGRANRPGVYTKVTNYLDWIGEKMTF